MHVGQFTGHLELQMVKMNCLQSLRWLRDRMTDRSCRKRIRMNIKYLSDVYQGCTAKPAYQPLHITKQLGFVELYFICKDVPQNLIAVTKIKGNIFMGNLLIEVDGVSLTK